MEMIERFIDAVAHADAASMMTTLTDDVRLRAIEPAGIREAQGAQAVVDRFLRWFKNHNAEIVKSSCDPFGGRMHASYRFRLTREGAAWDLEQQAFLDVDVNGIRRIDLVCSGFLPVVEQVTDGTFSYDAGSMSCNEGLDGEFKRALTSIPVGAILEVRARDASAKVELPSFARLLGHEVRGMEEPAGGGVVVRVQRKR